MKKLFTLCSILLLSAVNVFAQGWTRPEVTGSDLVPGDTVFLYNKEAAGFFRGLGEGSSPHWGSRAGVGIAGCDTVIIQKALAENVKEGTDVSADADIPWESEWDGETYIIQNFASHITSKRWDEVWFGLMDFGTIWTDRQNNVNGNTNFFWNFTKNGNGTYTISASPKSTWIADPDLYASLIVKDSNGNDSIMPVIKGGERLGIDLSDPDLQTHFEGYNDNAPLAYEWFIVRKSDFENIDLTEFTRYNEAMSLKALLDAKKAEFPSVNFSGAEDIYNNTSSSIEELQAAKELVAKAIVEAETGSATPDDPSDDNTDDSSVVEGDIVVEHDRVVGLGYTTDVVKVDMDSICTLLGISSISEATVWGVNTTTMEYVADAMQTYDGWRNTNGDFTTWGNNHQICYQHFNNGEYNLCVEPSNEPVVGSKYNLYWAFTTEADTVLLQTIVNIVDVPTLRPEIVKTIIVNHKEKPNTVYSGTTNTFDVTAVTEALGIADIAEAEQYIVNVTDGSCVRNTTDGWRDANGDAASWGNEGGICVKINNPASGIIDYIGCYDNTWDEGDTYTAKWAFVCDGKAVVINVNITFTEKEGDDDNADDDDIVVDGKDYTAYIANAGFDEDLSFTVDGQFKEGTVPNDAKPTLSGRSWSYVHPDGSCYAYTDSRSPNWKGTDGRTWATNGYVAAIKGWECTRTDYPKCEWIYFGVLPYDLAEKAVPVTDDGATYQCVPTTKPDADNGDDNVGALFFRAGWGGECSYKQDVVLPLGKYRLEYWTINVNPNSTAASKDITNVKCKDSVFEDISGNDISSTEWTKHYIDFDASSDVTIEFGYKAANSGSGGQIYVFVDGVKLYRIDGDDNTDDSVELEPGDDCSRFITNSTFDEIGNYTGWNGTKFGAGGTTSTCAEHYSRNYNTYQDISIDLPVGIYKVGVKGFYRAGGTDNDWNTKDDPTFRHAKLYAVSGEDSLYTAIPAFSSYAQESAVSAPNEVQYAGYYLPNSMADFTAYKEAGLIDEVSVLVPVTNNRLRIGVVKNTYITNDWTIVDDFTLEYYGNTVEAYYLWRNQMLATVPSLDNIITDGTLYTEYYKTAFETVIETAKTSADAAAITATIKAINPALDSLQANITAYKNYQAKLEEAQKTLLNDGLDGNAEPVMLLMDYFGSNDEPGDDDRFPNGGAIYIIENCPLSTADLVAETEVLTKWIQVANTCIETGSDCTDMLVNPDFTDGKTGWTTGSGCNPAFAWGVAEIYGDSHGQVDISQTLTGIKPGIYSISVQAFERPAQNGSYDGTEEPKVFLYMGDLETPVQNITTDLGEEPAQSYDYLWTSPDGSRSGYIPNSMEGANLAFAAGRYVQECYGIVGDDGIMKIGLTSHGVVPHWVLFDNFKLTYMGEDVDAMAQVLENHVSKVQAYLDNHGVEMTTAAVIALEEAIANADMSVESGDYDAMVASIKDINTALNDAKGNVAALAEFISAIDALCIALMEYEPTATEEAIINAYTAMEKAYLEFTTEELKAATEEMKYATVALKIPNTVVDASDENPVDLTSVIANACFDEGANVGWSFTKNGGNGPEISNGYDGPGFEFWNSSAASLQFNLYQEVMALPAGKYTVAADLANSYNGQIPGANGGRGILYADVVVGTDTTTYSVEVGPQTWDCTAKWNNYEVTFDVPADAKVIVGTKSHGVMDARWYMGDSFTLTYYGTESSKPNTGDFIPAFTGFTGYWKVKAEQVDVLDGNEYPTEFKMNILYCNSYAEIGVTKFLDKDIADLNNGGIVVNGSNVKPYSATIAGGGYVGGSYPNYLKLCDVNGKDSPIEIFINKDGSMTLSPFCIMNYNFDTGETSIAAYYSSCTAQKGVNEEGGDDSSSVVDGDIIVEYDRVAGLGYAADVVRIDMDSICAMLGISSISEATVWGVNTTTMEYVADAMTEYDGWRNAEGDFTKWGDNHQICYQHFNNGEYNLCVEPSNEPVVGAKFNLYWAFTTETDTVLLQTIVNVVDTPTLNPEIVKTITVNHNEKPNTIYSGTTNTFDVAAVTGALGITNIAEAEQYIVNVTDGNYVKNTTDGWRNAAGDVANWGSGDKMVCVKISDPASGIIDYIGCIDDNWNEGEVYIAKWAFVYDGKAVVVNVAITFTEGEDGDDEVENGEDCTDLIVNAKFADGFNGWTYKSGFLGGLKYVMPTAEVYENVVDVYQEIEGLKPGLYAVSVQAFERPATNGEYDGSEEPKAYVFMNEAQAPVMNILADAMPEDKAVDKENCYITQTTGEWPYDYGYYMEDGAVHYIPNSMDGASYAFKGERYVNTCYGIVGEDGKMKLGLTSNGQTVHWALFANFKLAYLGEDTDIVSEILLKQIERAWQCYEREMTEPVIFALEEAIMIAEDAMGIGDYGYMNEALAGLNYAIADAERNANIFEECYLVVDMLDIAICDYESSATEDALARALTILDVWVNGEHYVFTTEELEGMIAEMKYATAAVKVPYDVLDASDENPVDLTYNVIANPAFDEGATVGWLHTKNGGNGPEMNNSFDGPGFEFWNSSAANLQFNLYQDVLALPAGRYSLSADLANSLNGQSGGSNDGRAILYAQVAAGSDTTMYYVDVEVQTEDCTDKWKTYQVIFDVPADAIVTIGTKNRGIMDARWYMGDSFSLIYYGTDSSMGEGEEVLPENIFVDEVIDVTLPDSIPADYKPNLTIGYMENDWLYGALTLNGNNTLSIGKFHMTYDYNVAYDHYYYAENAYHTALINNASLRADSVAITTWNHNDVWTFLSFPYDVKVSDIIPKFANTNFVIRKYSGKDRAEGNFGSTWQGMTADSTLRAGEGYIWQSSRYDDNDNYTSYSGFDVPAVNNGNKNQIFANGDRTVVLNEYLSEFNHNRSWNLIGNPYPSFYDIRFMDFTAPITVWDSYYGTYYAYSPIDDEYILSPGEAFFVQRPVEVETITFNANGRQTDRVVRADAETKDREVGVDVRQVFNLTLSGDGTKGDRTRFIINPVAACDYDMSMDASKFMSSDASAPQLYTIEGNVHFAINERPMGSGSISLGAYFGCKGVYTIALNTKVQGLNVVLIDNLTGVETDLMNDSYTFDAESGVAEGRFEIRLSAIGDNDSATGIDGANANASVKAVDGQIVVDLSASAYIEVYKVDGTRVAATAAASATFDVEPGIYMVKVQNAVHKVSVAR